jgi:hypothetical protein
VDLVRRWDRRRPEEVGRQGWTSGGVPWQVRWRRGRRPGEEPQGRRSSVKRRGEGSTWGGAPGPRPCLAAGPSDLVRGIGRDRPGGAGAQGSAAWPRRRGLLARWRWPAGAGGGSHAAGRGGRAAWGRQRRGQRGVQTFGSSDPAAALRPAAGVGETWARPRESLTQLQGHDGVGRHCTSMQ